MENSLEKLVTKEQMAESLNERLSGQEISPKEELIAKECGLVVVFVTQNVFQAKGAISDFFSSETPKSNKSVFITENGEIEHCEDNCKHYERAAEKAKKISAILKNNFKNNFWVIETEIPFAEFDIFDDGELYCKGIVFDIENLK